MTVWAYYRVSTDKQDYENQKQGVVRYCEYKNIIIDKEVIEENTSGKIEFKKRKLGELIKKLNKGDLLVVSELSRLSRSMIDTFEMVKELKTKGVNVYCVKENMEISDSALGLMIMSVFAFSAQIERERISERTKEALARVKADGRKLGRAFGTKNKVNKAEKYKDIIMKMKKEGYPKVKIANAIGVSLPTLIRYEALYNA